MEKFCGWTREHSKEAQYPPVSFQLWRESMAFPHSREDGAAQTSVAERPPETEVEDGAGLPPSKRRKLEDVQAWIEIRASLHAPAVESFCPPINPCCHICQSVLKDLEIWKCGDCDSQAVLCSSCTIREHSKYNLIHEMEVWDGNAYVKRVPNGFRWEWKRHDGHTCMTSYKRQLNVFDHKGSPRRPQSAISLSLMRMISLLQLECGVSMRGIISAIQEAFPSNQPLDLYSILVKECYEEFRHWQFEQRTCSILAPGLADGSSCPMCPKENRTLCVAADALFGLPRKKSSGESFEPPKHEDRFFLKQSEVDSFVEHGNTQPERHYPDLMNNKDFVVPVFHSYGHNLACQFQFNTRFHKGTGLADGERSERLWSYLRRFGKITKEMTPSHRTDLLSDAPLHYSAKVQKKQITGIPQRLLKAEKIKVESMKELTDVIKSLPEPQWKTSGVWGKDLADSLKKQDVSLSWEETYAETLHHFQRGQLQLDTSQGGPQVVDLISRTKKAQRKIQAIEKRNNVEQRWSLTSPQAQAFLISAMEKRAKEVLNNIFNLTLERKFMCGLVRKYAEGQSIAARLSRQIVKLNSKIKASIKLFNLKRQAIPSTNLPYLTFEMAINMEAGVWSQKGKGDDPAFYLKQRLFVLICLSDRASVERSIIEEDLRTAKTFFHQELAKTQEALCNFSSSSRFDRGAVTALTAKVRHSQHQLDLCHIISQNFQADSLGIAEGDPDCDDSEEDEDDDDDEENDLEEQGVKGIDILHTPHCL